MSQLLAKTTHLQVSTDPSRGDNLDLDGKRDLDVGGRSLKSYVVRRVGRGGG